MGRQRIDAELIGDIARALGAAEELAEDLAARALRARTSVVAGPAVPAPVPVVEPAPAPPADPAGGGRTRPAGRTVAALLLAGLVLNMTGWGVTELLDLPVYLDMLGHRLHQHRARSLVGRPGRGRDERRRDLRQRSGVPALRPGQRRGGPGVGLRRPPMADGSVDPALLRALPGGGRGLHRRGGADHRRSARWLLRVRGRRDHLSVPRRSPRSLWISGHGVEPDQLRDGQADRRVRGADPRRGAALVASAAATVAAPAPCGGCSGSERSIEPVADRLTAASLWPSRPGRMHGRPRHDG